MSLRPLFRPVTFSQVAHGQDCTPVTASGLTWVLSSLPLGGVVTLAPLIKGNLVLTPRRKARALSVLGLSWMGMTPARERAVCLLMALAQGRSPLPVGAQR